MKKHCRLKVVVQTLHDKTKNLKTTKAAFTLAEVLITLVIIGVVAAITVPMLLHQEGDRVNSERHANIVYKIAQATDLMKSQGNLGKFATTDEFVDEIQKYLKINKRCDSDHIAECWPTSKVKTMSGEEYEVKNAKTRKDLLGDEINSPDNNNVGIVLADGAHIILTYNPDNEGMSAGETIVHTPGLLPVGDGKEEFLNFTSNSMAGMAFVFDVNGNRGQNAERQGENSYKDIRSFNGARFRPASELDPCYGKDACCKYEFDRKLAVGDKCYFELPTTYTWANAKTACGNTVSGATQVGALPGGSSDLNSVCNTIKSHNGNNTTSPFTSGQFWSAGDNQYGGSPVGFPGCSDPCLGNAGCYSKGNTKYVLCAGN